MEKDLREKVNKRIAILQGLMTLAFILLTGWLFGLQVLDFSGYKAKGIAIRSTDSPTLRGNILDRNGIKLATDEMTYEVYAHPCEYSSKRPPEYLAEILSPALCMPKEEVLAKLKSKKRKIRKLGLREISVGTINRRFYPQGNIASHIIGYYSYLSKNSIGIENTGKGKLESITDTESVQRKANGDIIFDFDTDVNNITKKQKGEDITLTIDASVQYICEKEQVLGSFAV